MHVIGDNIRALRRKHQMTQAQLAAVLGVQYQTVSKWETGTTVPDTMLLPQLAEALRVSIDELFGRSCSSCRMDIPDDAMEFLLGTYTQMYGPEAGPWNLSLENKYLTYRITEFFEKHFTVSQTACICNIGIGAGEWDTYLSYRLRDGTLTSIDKLPICCEQLQQRLHWERNPHEVRVICADAMDVSGQFDIVTMVGSTVMESGIGLSLLEKAMSLVKPGGAIYYQTLEPGADCNEIIRLAHRHGLRLDAMQQDDAYEFCCHYYKFSKIDIEQRGKTV